MRIVQIKSQTFNLHDLEIRGGWWDQMLQRIVRGGWWCSEALYLCKQLVFSVIIFVESGVGVEFGTRWLKVGYKIVTPPT